MNDATISCNIALAHHWLTQERGGEKVLKAMCELFPNAEIHTLLRSRNFNSTWIRNHKVRSSVLRLFPFSEYYFRYLLPCFPKIISSIPSPKAGTDLVLSSDAALIKGFPVPSGVLHVCYCHSPPRYLWEMEDLYFGKNERLGVGKRVLNSVIANLRAYDFKVAQSVDHFIANSEFVADRIRNYYKKESIVIHPPVNLDMFEFKRSKLEFFLIVSELVPYKRVDLAISAFGRTKEKLVVVGGGPLFEKLKAKSSSNVEMVGRVSDSELANYYSTAKALIFPGVEDFGITPLEAQASGTPVIGLRKGGCMETIVDGVTGVFFDEQTEECLIDAIDRFSEQSFAPEECRKNAEKFSVERFKMEISKFIKKVEDKNEA